MTATSLLGNQEKKHLRRIGHELNPTVTVADKGLSETVLNEIERALKDHELIKIKVNVADRETRNQLITQLSETSAAEVIQTVGRVALLFRKSKKPNPKLSNLLRSVGKK